MHLNYTELVYIYVYNIHTHIHIFATHMAPGVANLFFFFSLQNRLIVLFKSFQPDLRTICKFFSE